MCDLNPVEPVVSGVVIVLEPVVALAVVLAVASTAKEVSTCATATESARRRGNRVDSIMPAGNRKTLHQCT
jgi:hypothetical protein